MSNPNYHHKNLKEEMIKKGLKLLNEEGYNNFSLRNVAKACNVSHSAPYNHFENKDKLVIAIIVEASERFTKVLEEAVIEYPNDIINQVKEMAFLYIKFLVENPDYLKLIFLSNIERTVKSNAENVPFLNGTNQPYQVFANSILKYVEYKKAEDPVKTINEEEIILEVWGMAHGMAILIAQRDVHIDYNENYLDLVKKTIWNSPIFN